METKEQLRHYIRKIKKQLTVEQKKLLSQFILSRLEENRHFKEAKTILLYYALPDEVETEKFIGKWWQAKQIILPKVQGDDLILYPYTGKEHMKQGAFGILEPSNQTPYNIEQIDLAIIPGLAFDQNKNRLGRGKGYYDRLLSQIKTRPIYKIGIAFPFQIVDYVPTEGTDIAMDEVLY